MTLFLQIATIISISHVVKIKRNGPKGKIGASMPEIFKECLFNVSLEKQNPEGHYSISHLSNLAISIDAFSAVLTD